MKRQNAKYYLAGLVSIITFVVYLTSLRNEFVQWDDDLYVFDNPYIRSLNAGFFKWAFFDFYATNWHPLTWISHALDYAVWGLNPLGHHLTNNILHAVNSFLVVLVVAKLVEAVDLAKSSHPKIGGEPVSEGRGGTFLDERGILIAAATTGLLFGLHPIHVESVAWVAERKDLLCALFFLLSIGSYKSYTINRTYKTYLLSLSFFILALMSKPMAVSLPLVLLILDWYPFGRITSFRTFRTALIEKIPFIVLSLGSTVLTIMAQKKGGAMNAMDFVPLSARLLIAIKSLIAYLGKMVWPVKLIPFYPYPGREEVLLLSPVYIVALLLVAGITIISFITLKKQRVCLATWGYYVLTLLPVLGIIQVGEQAMADRYTYLPGLSPFLFAGVAAAWGFQKLYMLNQRTLIVKLLGSVAVISLFLSMGYITFKQIGVWKNGVTLWTYVIEKGGTEHSTAYNNRGLAFSTIGQIDKAIEDYNKAITLNPSLFQAYTNRGIVLTDKGQLDKAMEDYNKAIALNPSHSETYNNRALLFIRMGQTDKALEDYNKAIDLNPSNSVAYNNRASAFMSKGQFDRAIEDYNKTIALSPSHEAYYVQGIAFEAKGQLDKAIEDYNEAIALNPSYIEAYIRMGVLYGKSGSFDKAIGCFDKAISINPNYPPVYGNRGLAYSLMGHHEKALEDLGKAIALNKNNAAAYVNRANVHLKRGDKNLARSDFQMACTLGEKSACETLKHSGL